VNLHHNESHGAAAHTGDVIPAANQDFGAFFSDFAQIIAPANPAAGTRRVFVDSADGKLKVRTSAGVSVSLEEQGGAGGGDITKGNQANDATVIDIATTASPGTLLKSLTFTPTSTAKQVMLLASVECLGDGAAIKLLNFRWFRGAGGTTALGQIFTFRIARNTTDGAGQITVPVNANDAPASVAQQTYELRAWASAAGPDARAKQVHTLEYEAAV
jgi:hypothetical protein